MASSKADNDHSAHESARAVVDPHFDDANDAALRRLDLRRVAGIIGTSHFRIKL
jgi:hypothetical protein